MSVRIAMIVAGIGVSACMASPAAAQQWVPCAEEGQTCVVPYPTSVRYGANGAFAFKQAKGPIHCSNQIFGDPLYNVRKACAYQARTAAAPAPHRVTTMGRPLSGNCATRYLEWKRKPGAKAFALTDDGKSCAWSNDKPSVQRAQADVLQSCRARFLRPCSVTEFYP